MAKQQMQALQARRNGGLARAEMLSPERRSEIAKVASAARWDGDAIARADAKRRASLAAAKLRIEERISKLTSELKRINAALQERYNGKA